MSSQLQYSVVASTFAQDVRESLRRSREEGFDGIVFDARSPAIAFAELSASGRREVRQLLASQRQTLVALRADLGPRGFAPGADLDRAIAGVASAFEAAAGVGALSVLVDLGPLPAPAHAPPKPRVTPQQAGLILLPESVAAPAPQPSSEAPKSDPAFIAQLDAALAELGRHADRLGMTVAFGNSLASFASLDQALQRVACPWFGVDLDPIAILRDDWDVDAIFSRLGPLIRHVRARDAALGAEKRTKPLPIGRGDTNWGQLLDALHDTDYRGWLTIDPTDLPDRLGAARGAATYLRQLVKTG